MTKTDTEIYTIALATGSSANNSYRCVCGNGLSPFQLKAIGLLQSWRNNGASQIICICVLQNNLEQKKKQFVIKETDTA